MKKILLILVLFVIVRGNTSAQNIPPVPAGYGNTNLPAGSYVIAMDNTNQGTAGVFNMKAYGLLVDLLNNNKRLKWVIKALKAKDAIDFSGNAKLMTTSATITTTSFGRNITTTLGSSTATLSSGAGVLVGMLIAGQDPEVPLNTFVTSVSGNTITMSNAAEGVLNAQAVTLSIKTLNSSSVSFGGTASYDFRAGPFVIFNNDPGSNSDTSGVAALVAFYNARLGTNVKVYMTTADINNVGVRFDYKINGVIWKPKVAILDDGGNGDIHADYMPLAGISGSNGFANWGFEQTPNFVNKCYTMATEPHNGKDTTNVIQAAPLITTGTIIRDIRKFVENGGNFLAQCHAVWTYENYFGSGPVAPGQGGRFMTKEGIWRGVNAGSDAVIANETFLNSDLSYGQIHGVYQQQGGSLETYKLNNVVGNVWVNSEHPFVTGALADAQDQIRVIGAAKLTAANKLGGMVFYLGSHKYDLSDEENRNGMRYYMNAVLTPTDPQGSLQTTGFVACGNKVTPVTAPVGVASAPLGAYPINFKLFRETGVEAGLQQSGPNADVQVGATVSIAAPPAVQTGVINAGILPPGSNNDYYLVTIPAEGCLQATILEAFCSNLPVSLLNFNAQRNGDNVKLTWETASEDNSKGFNIERKDGSKDWKDVGFVASQAAGGNSSSRLSYQFSDINTEIGISQYRLKQLDINGNYEYSTIRSVHGEGQVEKTTVFPNPSNDGSVNVLFGGANVARDIKVYDVSGRIIRQWKKESSNTIQIENLVPGFYSVRILNTETGKQEVHKIIVNKR